MPADPAAADCAEPDAWPGAPAKSACLATIDSSGDALAIGVLAADGRRELLNAAGGAQASATLLPALRRLLQAAGLTIAALDAVAFGRGPGAFTGLRTACAVAQGLAFGADRPVLAVDSLLICAEDAYASQSAALPRHAEWWVAVDARMDEVYAAHYRRDDRHAERADWTTLRPPALYTLAALAEAWRAAPPRALAGNAAAVFGSRLPLAGIDRFGVETDRAAALLRLAEAAWRQGAAVDAADALPLYLRDKVALTSAERDKRRGEAAA